MPATPTSPGRGPAEPDSHVPASGRRPHRSRQLHPPRPDHPPADLSQERIQCRLAQILGFVARRLLAERIAVVCAARTGIGDDVLAGLPVLPIHPLGDSDARALLLANVPGPLDAAVCDQIIKESHGNPLALLELPRTWTVADLAGGFGFPGGEPVAGRIEQSYMRCLQRLPADTQLLILTAAAEPLGDRVLLHRAAGTLGINIGPSVRVCNQSGSSPLPLAALF